MRLFTTIFLALCTTALTAWFIADLIEQNNQSLLDDSGAIPNGRPLFDNPALLDRHTITLSNKNTKEHVFKLNRNSIWECTAPYQDRADGIFYIKPILDFTMAAEVIESIPLNEIELKNFDLQDKWTKITVKDIHNNIAASYKLGIKSAWKHRVTTKDERGQTVNTDFPTVYVIKENAEDSNMLYLVADPTFKIHSLLKNNFEGFRDHRPFALNRKYMEEISIKRAKREIVLDHSSHLSPWNITKPLERPVDKKALAKLLVDISTLQAIKLHQKDSITLPQETDNLIEVSIKNFDSDDKTTLTIYPPKDQNAKTSFATISNRNIIFELPNQPIKGLRSSVASLPTSVNSLRARNMLTLARQNIRGFVIRTPRSQPIVIVRPTRGAKYQLLTTDNKKIAPNEIAIANLIATISTEPVKAFISDAATDLSLYGFNSPILEIVVTPFTGKNQRLRFSRKGDRIFATLLGKSDVWEVDTSLYLRIAKKEWGWKNNTIWDLLKNDISQFTIQHRNKEKITVNYDYLADSISATVGKSNRDVTSQINPIQVKYFINSCAKLEARRRLGPSDQAAKTALKRPILNITITIQEYNIEGMPLTPITHTLSIAKASEKSNISPFYFAKSSTDPDYFMIKPATLNNFFTNLFSEE